MARNDNAIRDVQALEAAIGEPLEMVRAKLRTSLNAAMTEFIRRSPLAFISTIDEAGPSDISPKGDPAGFVQVDKAGDLLIPERPGNRLTFGFRNILRNGAIGLLFVVPNQRETLRVKSMASLHDDPEVLAGMAVNGKPALLCTHVEVRECFFHCGKALIRSGLWRPDSWDGDSGSIAARGFAGDGLIAGASLAQTEAALEQSYTNELY